MTEEDSQRKPGLIDNDSTVTPAPLTAVKQYETMIPQPGNYRIDTRTTIRKNLQRLAPVIRNAEIGEIISVTQVKEQDGIIYGKVPDGWLILFDGDKKMGPASRQFTPKRSPKGMHGHMTMTDLQQTFDLPKMQSYDSVASMKTKVSDGIGAASMRDLADSWNDQVSVVDVMNGKNNLEMVMLSEDYDMEDAGDLTEGGADFESDIVDPNSPYQ